MSRILLSALGVVVIIVGILAYLSLFTVHQTEQALVVQFGNPVETIKEPGLHEKWPWQNVMYYEKRVLNIDPPVERVILAGQRPLLVDSFARYRIVDPLRFFQTVREESGVRERLGTIINASVRAVLGGVTLSTVLSAERADIMTAIKEDVTTEANRFGIEVVDVRMRRADLPDKTAESVYARMRSEREREARESRAKGAEVAQRIRSRADREKVVIVAEAQREAQILRGDGDAESIKIYADAFGKDPQFFAFYRSMEAYRNALGAEDTTLVLSPDSDFFRFFGDMSGGAGKAK